MNLAKVSANGQTSDDDIVISNASAEAISKAQNAFSGVAESMGVKNEEDVTKLVREVRYREK